MSRDDLKDIGQILADATRVDTLRLVLSSPEPVTASMIAESFGLHPNAARHHLAKLESAGLIRSQMKRNPSGGRPAKVYSVGPDRVDIQFPARRFGLLSSLLADALAACGTDAGTQLNRIGKEYGESIGRPSGPHSRSLESAPEAVAGIIASKCAELNLDVRVADSTDQAATLIAKNCIFSETACNHPELVCVLCEGILKGIADASGFSIDLAYQQRIAEKNDACVSSLTLVGRS